VHAQNLTALYNRSLFGLGQVTDDPTVDADRVVSPNFLRRQPSQDRGEQGQERRTG
jgi:hypothetical protein